jgi:hypothetical protein
VWRLNEESTTVLKVHYGDYYDALTASQFFLLTDRPIGSLAESFDQATGQWTPYFREQVIAFADEDIRHPYVRQFTAGIDQDLPGHLALARIIFTGNGKISF